MAGFSFFREASMVLSGDWVVVGGGEVCNESHTRSEKINLEIIHGRTSPPQTKPGLSTSGDRAHSHTHGCS